MMQNSLYVHHYEPLETMFFFSMQLHYQYLNLSLNLLPACFHVKANSKWWRAKSLTFKSHSQLATKVTSFKEEETKGGGGDRKKRKTSWRRRLYGCYTLVHFLVINYLVKIFIAALCMCAPTDSSKCHQFSSRSYTFLWRSLINFKGQQNFKEERGGRKEGMFAGRDCMKASKY